MDIQTETRDVVHHGDVSAEKTCALCQGSYLPRTRWQAFCSRRCRNDYDLARGTVGVIAGVRKVKAGVSIVVHLSGPAAEAALNLQIGESARLVKEPR